jgi:hypothetical protein
MLQRMTFHFSAVLPDLGIGILSDSVVSYQRGDGSWSRLELKPKTFVVSSNAAVSCAGSQALCMAVINKTVANLSRDATFCEIAPRIQQAYLEVADDLGADKVEFLLAARTQRKEPKLKLIKYNMKRSGMGLQRQERLDQHHFTAGLSLPDLARELCEVLTLNYPIAGSISEKIGGQLCSQSDAIKSPKSFGIGICFGAFMPVVKDYVQANDLMDTVGSPWTILVMPEDGPIHFQSSEMYDGSQSVQPYEI